MLKRNNPKLFVIFVDKKFNAKPNIPTGIFKSKINNDLLIIEFF